MKKILVIFITVFLFTTCLMGSNALDGQQGEVSKSGLYYETASGIYYIDTNGLNKRCVISGDVGSGWAYIKEAKAIYFKYDNKLCKTNLSGTEVTQLTKGQIESWQSIKDEVTGQTWIFCKGENKVSSYIMSLDGKQKVSFKYPDISSVAIYNNQVFYTVQGNLCYGETVQCINLDEKVSPAEQEGKIYCMDLNGASELVTDLKAIYKPIELFNIENSTTIVTEIVAIKDQSIYISMEDHQTNTLTVYEYNLGTATIRKVYQTASGFEAYINVEVEDDYIYIDWIRARHDYAYVQLDRQDLRTVDYGRKIGEDANNIYKIQDNRIYAFNRSKQTTALLTNVFPMEWYADLKGNEGYVLGNWIYFNDYEVYPSKANEERREIPDKMYRLNLQTKQREVAGRLIQDIEGYKGITQDASGNYYFIVNQNNIEGIAKGNEKSQVLIGSTSESIDQLIYIESK